MKAHRSHRQLKRDQKWTWGYLRKILEQSSYLMEWITKTYMENPPGSGNLKPAEPLLAWSERFREIMKWKKPIGGPKSSEQADTATRCEHMHTDPESKRTSHRRLLPGLKTKWSLPTWIWKLLEISDSFFPSFCPFLSKTISHHYPVSLLHCIFSFTGLQKCRIVPQGGLHSEAHPYPI